MINLGLARAIVSKPVPPVRRDLLWHKQTDPATNPEIGELRYYDWDVNDWLLLHDGDLTFKTEVLPIASDDQTIFALAASPVIVENSQLWVMGVIAEYGTHYTIAGNILTWLDVPFQLISGNNIQIKYNI